MKSIVLLGTVHSVRGAEKSPRKQIDDPSYRKLIELFVSCCDVDYIFEEASGCGPTDAEKIANRHSIRYKDVDLHPDERRQRGLLVEGASPHSIDEAKPEDFYIRENLGVHAQREDSWLKSIKKRHFSSGLMICGVFHVLSFAFKLRSAGFDVDCLRYTPFQKLLGE